MMCRIPLKNRLSRCRALEELARKTFRFSIWHLSLLFAALLADHYLGPMLHGLLR